MIGTSAGRVVTSREAGRCQGIDVGVIRRARILTPGAVLRGELSPLPTASYTVRVAESTDRRVRWEITMTAPWGLTFGEKIAIEDNGWRIRTAEWCHMEPERL